MKYWTYKWKDKNWLMELKEKENPLEIIEKYFMIPKEEITNLKEITKMEYESRK